jgi:RNA methyltransferase, TrmH family
MPDELIVAEGPHLLEEVQGSEWKIEQVFCTPEARERFRDILADVAASVTEVAPRAMAQISGTETPQGILALLRPPHWTWTDLIGGGAAAIVLDEIQDPGNVGTIARSADAFGATGIVLSRGTARVPNGKVLRAAAGSLFRMPFLETVTRTEIVKQLSSARVKVYALTASGKTRIGNANLLDPYALVVGNEGAGLNAEWLSIAETVSIPTMRVESLNAAVACSIALFETARQRSSK